MDSRTPERAMTPNVTAPPDVTATADVTATPEALEFVRFCRHRRTVGWPELYDEMCAVAARGTFRGWGADELGAHGIGFSLFDMPRLAMLVRRVIADERDGRGTSQPSIRQVSKPPAVTNPAGELDARRPKAQDGPGPAPTAALATAGV